MFRGVSFPPPLMPSKTHPALGKGITGASSPRGDIGLCTIAIRVRGQ